MSALVANAVTSGLFNTNLAEFVTGRIDGAYKPGRDGSWNVTLPELFGAGPQGFGGATKAAGGFTGVVSHNFQQNWIPMIAQVVLIPIGAKIITKVLRKPVLTPTNNMLKQVGLNDVKV